MNDLEYVLANGRGVERSFRCHVHADSNASASVNSATGLWYCYACGARGRADTPEPTQRQMEKILAEAAVQTREPLPYGWLSAYTANSAYWKERLGDAQAVKAFGLGTHPITGNPTFPVFSFGGDLLGCGERADGVPRYRYPRGFRASESFGRITPWFASMNDLNPYPRLVTLVEGIADAAHLMAHRLGHAVLACWGSSLHVPQAKHLMGMGVRTLLVGFDDDEAGERGYERIVSGWGDSFDVRRIHWIAKDPGDLERWQAFDAFSKVVNLERKR